MFYRRYANVEYTKTGKATTFKNQHISIAFLSIPHFYRFHSCTITTIFLLSILYHHRHHISIVSLPHLHYHFSVVLPPPLPPPLYHISSSTITTDHISIVIPLPQPLPHFYRLPSYTTTTIDHISIVLPSPPPPPPLTTFLLSSLLLHHHH